MSEDGLRVLAVAYRWLEPRAGLTRLPVSYFALLIPATLTYLVLVDVAKRQLVRRLGL